MRICRSALGALAALSSMAVVGPRSQAGTDPAHFAEQCMQAADAAAQHRMRRNDHQAEHCVHAVSVLLAQGHEDEAQDVAVECIHDIDDGSEQSATVIRAQCAHCIEVLQGMGFPKLAAEVDEACRIAVQLIGHSKQAAVDEIKKALLGGGHSTGSTCPCDLDGNGEVGGTDLALLIGAWGTHWVSADFNDDGVVQMTDLAAMVGAWGPCP